MPSTDCHPVKRLLSWPINGKESWRRKQLKVELKYGPTKVSTIRRYFDGPLVMSLMPHGFWTNFHFLGFLLCLGFFYFK